MASAAVVEKSCGARGSGSNKAVLCKYYINGVCRAGKTCRYSHDKETTAPGMVCRYYLYGCCTYGSTCRYDHVKPKGGSSTALRPRAAQSPLPKQTTTTSKQCGLAAAPPPPPPLPLLQPVAPPVPHNTQNGFCHRTSKQSLADMIDWDLGLLDTRPTHTDSTSSSSSSFPSSVPWSTAPSTSDKVILRGGRIKTKADWAKDSQVFVPRKPINAPSLTYAQALSVEADGTLLPVAPPSFDSGSPDAADHDDCAAQEYTPKFDYPDPVFQEKLLCPYLEHGACPDMENCCYLHGELCEMCGANVLHPTNLDQRKEHEAECVRRLEENMEYSFLIAGSEGKECTICMEAVLDKKPPDNRFGLLPNCNHTFCLSCIRKWRACTLDKDVIRSCPQCRISSNFVTPSNVWVEDKEQKDKVINIYKEKMRKKPCKYFDMGRSKCPFGDSCFYKHAYPDGKLASPEKPGSRRHRADADGAVSCLPDHSLWEFIFEREQAAAVAMEAFDDDFYNMMWTSSDDSDDSDGDDFGLFGDYEERLQFIYDIGIIGGGDDGDVDDVEDSIDDGDDDEDEEEDENDADADDDDDGGSSSSSSSGSSSSSSSSGGSSKSVVDNISICSNSSSGSGGSSSAGGGSSPVAIGNEGNNNDDGDVGGGSDEKKAAAEEVVKEGGGGVEAEGERGKEGGGGGGRESNCDGRSSSRRNNKDKKTGKNEGS